MLTPEERRKYFVDESETVYTEFMQDVEGNGIDREMSTFELIVTDKNIYTNIISENDQQQENIIDLKTVEFVKYEHTKIKQNKNGLLTFGSILLIGGILLGSLTATINMVMPLIGFGLAIMGFIATIAAIALSRPKHLCQLVIGTSGEPIKLIANDVPPAKIKQIQKDIFRAKNNL